MLTALYTQHKHRHALKHHHVVQYANAHLRHARGRRRPLLQRAAQHVQRHLPTPLPHERSDGTLHRRRGLLLQGVPRSSGFRLQGADAFQGDGDLGLHEGEVVGPGVRLSGGLCQLKGDAELTNGNDVAHKDLHVL